MKHVVYTLLFATVAGALTFGAASSLPVTSDNLGSGGAGVASCDPDGVEVSYNLVKTDPSRVSAIVVSGIAKECIGQTLHYVVKSDNAKEVPLFGSRVIAAPSETFGVLDLTVEKIDEIAITIAG